MKYILFAGEGYYPAGGWGDFKGLFHTPELAVEAFNSHNATCPSTATWDWWHVVNATSLEVVADRFNRMVPIK